MSIADSVKRAKESSGSAGTMFKTFYAWYDNLSEKDRNDLDTALLSGEVSIRKLFYSLKEFEGVSWGDNALYYHANSLKQEN
jgi:hypothetical protein